jgi:ATP-dependent Clp endopeptidase proteolytic subunit ClpP
MAGQTKKQKAEQELLELEVKIRQADLDKETIDLQTRKLELEKLKFDKRSAEAAAKQAEIEAADLKWEFENAQRSRKIHLERKKTRTSVLSGIVSERMADYLRGDFITWETEDKVDGKAHVPVTLLINSPGGYVVPGLDMFDLIMEYRAKGWTINTKVTGMAMSMAGVLLQAGEVREMAPRSTFMLHEVASYAEGKTSDIEDQLALTKALQLHCSSILAERSHLSIDEVDELWRRRDVFLTAEQTLEKGFIDRISK